MQFFFKLITVTPTKQSSVFLRLITVSPATEKGNIHHL